MEEKYDVVNKPKHYNREGGFESIEEMEMVFGTEAVMHFCLLNVWKYRYRAADKNGEEDFDRVLRCCEDRMAYSAMEDYNMWCFTPYSMEDISNLNENFIVFDYDDEIENKDYIYETDFNKDIFFRFSNRTRLFRLMDYLSFIYEPVNMEKLKEIIGKDDFIPKDQIMSGYKYMNSGLLMD